MPIIIKTRREIEMMRRAGTLGCEILAKMREAAKPGVSTFDLDELARAELEKAGGIALSKNYPTYKPGEGFRVTPASASMKKWFTVCRVPER